MEIREADVSDALDLVRLLTDLGYPADIDDVRQRIGRFVDSDRDTILVAVSKRPTECSR